MIVKNEEKVLYDCISPLLEVVDEIIIVDTGSTDGTRTSPLPPFKGGIKWYETVWEDDFSKARNFALEKASKEWIMVVDADERISAESALLIKDLVKDKEAIAYLFNLQHFFGNENVSSGIISHKSVNLFRNRSSFRYKGAIHEQILPFIRLEAIRSGLQIKDSGITIKHYGYLDNIFQAQNKLERSLLTVKKALENPELSVNEEIYYKINLAGTLFMQNNFQESKAQFLEILDIMHKLNKPEILIQPVNSKLYIYLFKLYMQEHSYQEALSLMNQAVTYLTDAPVFYYFQAQANLKLRSFQNAYYSYQRCLGLKETHNQNIPFAPGITGYFSYFGSGYCLTKLGQLEEAKKYFEKALTDKPDFTPAKLALGELLKIT